MNDPITDLQTLLTASFTPANVTSISTVPQVKKGREYNSLTEATINVLTHTSVFEDVTAKYRTEIFTLICELQINLADSTAIATIETAIDETIEEIDSVFNTNNDTSTTQYNIQLMGDYLKDHWIEGISIEVTYMGVSK